MARQKPPALRGSSPPKVEPKQVQIQTRITILAMGGELPCPSFLVGSMPAEKSDNDRLEE